MDKKTYKPFIILTIIAFFIACTPFILWGYIEIMVPGWTTHCPAGGYCSSGYFEKKLLNNILNSLFTFIVLSLIIWLGPIIKYTKQKNNEREIRENNILKNNNLSPQEKTSLVESEKNTRFFLFSTVLSGVVVVIIFVFAMINGKNMLSASKSGVGAMGFLAMIPFYIIIILLEVVATVFSIILFSKFKKFKKNGIEPTKRLKTLRRVNKILFIIILCWPVCFAFVESLIRFFSLQT